MSCFSSHPSFLALSTFFLPLWNCSLFREQPLMYWLLPGARWVGSRVEETLNMDKLAHSYTLREPEVWKLRAQGQLQLYSKLKLGQATGGFILKQNKSKDPEQVKTTHVLQVRGYSLLLWSTVPGGTSPGRDLSMDKMWSVFLLLLSQKSPRQTVTKEALEKHPSTSAMALFLSLSWSRLQKAVVN